MNKIQVLSLHIANQIAAGEVVERPSSIVKELLENAIDAGSTSITVEIDGGGIEYLRVSDNGTGIPAADVPTAFLRHATSKIATAEDLERIHTLGFRGEALSSIAAVARIRLTTRTAEAESGTCIEIAGGDIQSCGPIAWAEGTGIEVRDVFYNVPARRKFLKSRRAEAAAIGDFVSRIILAHPEISFRFLNAGKTIYQSLGDGDIKNAIYCVYGSKVLEHLRPFSYDDGMITIYGFLGTEQIARPNRLQQSLYVNGRYIHSQKVSFAAQRAFDTRLMSGKFPFYVMHLGLPWDEVDVNVHPQKLEVRFREEDTLLRAVTVACRKALGDSVAPLLRGVDLPAFRKQTSHFDEKIGEGETIAEREVYVPSNLREQLGDGLRKGEAMPMREASATSYSHSRQIQNWQRVDTPASLKEASQDNKADERKSAREAMPSLAAADATLQAAMEFGAAPYRVVGQLFDCYWIVQQGDLVFFIDQHAAHERRLYERLMAGNLAGASQMLLLPAVVKLSPAQFDLLVSNLPSFAELGFEMEEFGTLTVRITAVPDLLGEAQTVDFLFEALAMLEKQGHMGARELKRAALIQASCKYAIKAGAALAPEEISTLLEAYSKKGVPMTCPHGRPVMVQMQKLEFEKLFKRVL